MSNNAAFDIGFVIVGMKFKTSFEDGFFDEDEKKEIIDFIDRMSREMHIDSSYVDKKGTKYKNTFMLDDGWNALQDMIKDSKYGRFLHPKSQMVLIDAFSMMAKCYIYECISLLYDFEHIFVDVDPSSKFDVIFLKEDPDVWKRYPGKWQSWKDDSKKSK